MAAFIGPLVGLAGSLIPGLFGSSKPSAASQAADTAGKERLQRGENALQPSLDYWSKILLGDRSAGLDAVGPAAGAVNSQADQQRRAIAEGPRGGGTASASVVAPQNQTALLSQLLSGARQQAATANAGAGEALGRLGLGEQGVAAQNRGIEAQLSGQNKQFGLGIGGLLSQGLLGQREQNLKYGTNTGLGR